jgi:hypothetical protein
MITSDNAGNRGAMMEELSLLQAEGIPFDAEGNRIRYVK